ncbi:MAG: hypothetical protein U5L05_00965 [Rubrivivax sp.]|nr:hypothetical protein [Rubrivivax sp.]
MGPYLPLFSVEVRHTFFEPGPCRGLALLPTPASAARLHTAGCVLRATADGLAVFYDQAQQDLLRRRASDAAAPLEFHFHGRSADPWFASYTEGLQRDAHSLLFFDSTAAQAPDATGSQRLHADEFVATDSRQWRGTPALRRGLSRQDALLPPAFVVRVVVPSPDSDDADGSAWAASHTSRRYQVRLQTRATCWRYFLPADWEAQTPQVVDLAGQARFEPAAPVALGGGRKALSIRSLSAIPLHDRPLQRFQLRTGTAPAGRVLIKRLPVASAGQLNLETIDGVRTLVSEIYVNR